MDLSVPAFTAETEALRAARRSQPEAIVAAYLASESVARIAERTGRHPTERRNLLTAHRDHTPDVADPAPASYCFGPVAAGDNCGVLAPAWGTSKF